MKRVGHAVVATPIILISGNPRRIARRTFMVADRAEVSWDAGKSKWLVRITSSPAVIRTNHFDLPASQDTSARSATINVLRAIRLGLPEIRIIGVATTAWPTRFMILPRRVRF